jgi:uncharacterized phage-associated protein
MYDVSMSSETSEFQSGLDVAAAVLERHPGLDQMQLHKLLYLIQAASLSWYGEPAFVHEIQAWSFGPVVRGVAGFYKDFGDQPIDHPVTGDSSRLDDRAHWIVEQVVDDFGDLSGPELARLTKAKDSPWRQVRGDLPDDDPSQIEIPRGLIESFHRVHGVVVERPSDQEQRLINLFLDEGKDDAFADIFESATGTRPVRTQ